MYKYSGRELHELFLQKKLTAVEITTYFLNRIEKYDREVGAFLAIFKERALEKAKNLDARHQKGEKVGRLAAVPIALKDNMHVKGQLTTCGSKFLTNYRAPFDATLTELLEAEDAIIVGKTNLDEFAMGSSNENSALKSCSNPWDLSCVPGGSSGGSAAAAAARLVPIAFGSDTGGSVRQPAALCGVVGFKPSYGRVSRYGLVAFGSSLDQIGPIAAKTEDVAMVMEVVGAPDPHDATSSESAPEEYLIHFDENIKGKKIGIPTDFLANLNPVSKKIFLEPIEKMKELGCEVVEISLPSLKYSIAAYYILATAEASTNLARFDGIRYGVRAKLANA